MNLRQKIKKIINENFQNSENMEMCAASISTMIRGEILKQGFSRIDQSRDSHFFVNTYKNGLDTSITTQVNFKHAPTIKILFVLKTDQLLTQQETNRLNQTYEKIIGQIMTDIQLKLEQGEWNHLKTNFQIEYDLQKI